METKKNIKRIVKIAILAFLMIGVGGITTSYAIHSWGGYHWARKANPFTLKLGDNVSGVWDSYLATTSGDWSQSSILNTSVISGNTDPRRCKPTKGQVQTCSSKYGFNGWLGVASIWVSGSHITQSTVKVNDSYFDTSTYNTPAWRNLVMCQEVGHTLGLDHQDENFYNPPLGTCMDYSADPTLNQHPNQHDYDQLRLIYSHLDSISTLAQKSGNTIGNRSDDNGSNGKDTDDLEVSDEWGKVLKHDKKGRASIFERDLGKNEKIFTFVFWVE